MNQTQLNRKKAEQQKLIRTCLAMLEISLNRIRQQGTGCNIPAHGAAYKHGALRDSIAILLDPSAIRNYMFETIDSEQMKPVVAKLASKFSVKIQTADARSLFVGFLIDLQNAHDDAFDEYDKRDGDEMSNFVQNISDLRNKLNKKHSEYEQ